MLINIIILSLILCASTDLVGKVIFSMTGLNELRQIAKSLSNGAIFRSLCTVGGIGIDSNISNLLILRSIFNPYVKHRLRPKHHIMQLSSLELIFLNTCLMLPLKSINQVPLQLNAVMFIGIDYSSCWLSVRFISVG